MSYQREIDLLDRAIRDLKIDFERFFSGALPIPPEALRTNVQSQLRRLRNANLKSAVDIFRLSSLEARFNTYNELFNRRLREYEEGRGTAAGAAPPARRHDPQKGVLLGDRIDPDAVEALYGGLARGSGHNPRFDLDSFRQYLEQQVAAIRKKTGCDQVQFRLANEGDKMKLKAKPVGGGEPQPKKGAQSA